MQIILCSLRRSASGKRAIGMARRELFKKASVPNSSTTPKSTPASSWAMGEDLPLPYQHGPERSSTPAKPQTAAQRLRRPPWKAPSPTRKREGETRSQRESHRDDRPRDARNRGIGPIPP